MVSRSAVGARRSFDMASRTLFEESGVLLRLHAARLGFDGVLLWPHALVSYSTAERAKAKRRRRLFRHSLACQAIFHGRKWGGGGEVRKTVFSLTLPHPLTPRENRLAREASLGTYSTTGTVVAVRLPEAL